MIKTRMYLHDIQRLLNYKDYRSVRKWCRNNHVRVLSDTGSNRRFIFADELEKSMNRKKHIGWEIIHSPTDLLLHDLSVKSEIIKKYCPKGENEKRMLSIFTSI